MENACDRNCPVCSKPLYYENGSPTCFGCGYSEWQGPHLIKPKDDKPDSGSTKELYEEAVETLERLERDYNDCRDCGISELRATDAIRAHVAALESRVKELEESNEALAHFQTLYEEDEEEFIRMEAELKALKQRIEGAPKIWLDRKRCMYEIYAVPVDPEPIPPNTKPMSCWRRSKMKTKAYKIPTVSQIKKHFKALRENAGFTSDEAFTDVVEELLSVIRAVVAERDSLKQRIECDPTMCRGAKE